MVDMPTVDSARLANGVATFARQQIASRTQDALGTLTNITDGAESFGITGLSGFVEMLKGWATALLANFGISLGGSATQPPAPPAPVAAAPANTAAAQAAARAAASQQASNGTHVTTPGAPAATPQSPATPARHVS